MRCHQPENYRVGRSGEKKRVFQWHKGRKHARVSPIIKHRPERHGVRANLHLRSYKPENYGVASERYRKSTGHRSSKYVRIPSGCRLYKNHCPGRHGVRASPVCAVTSPRTMGSVGAERVSGARPLSQGSGRIAKEPEHLMARAHTKDSSREKPISLHMPRRSPQSRLFSGADFQHLSIYNVPHINYD